MKTASVADLRNDFARLSKWIAQGEKITITKRGEPFATLLPIFAQPAKKKQRIVWPDFTARIQEMEGVHGGTTARDFAEIRAAQESVPTRAKSKCQPRK